MRITLSPYTMATNCTDITDCNDGISELWDACDRYKAAGQKVPEYIYKRIEKLEAKRDKCSLKEHGMKYDEWILSRFDKLEGASDGYIEAYKEALKKWLKYQNYKGDKRNTVYHILRDNADSAREFLMQAPQELPNFFKINAWYFDEDITDYNTMVERIFGGLQGTKKAGTNPALKNLHYSKTETTTQKSRIEDCKPLYLGASNVIFQTSNDAAKIDNITQSAKRRLKSFFNGDFPKRAGNLWGQVEHWFRRLFNLKYEGQTNYNYYQTPKGVMDFRLSNHNASPENFKKYGADVNISVYVALLETGIKEADVEYTEYRYSKEDYDAHADEIIDAIIKGFKNALETGEFVDCSGYAKVLEHKKTTPTNDQPTLLSGTTPTDQLSLFGADIRNLRPVHWTVKKGLCGTNDILPELLPKGYTSTPDGQIRNNKDELLRIYFTKDYLFAVRFPRPDDARRALAVKTVRDSKNMLATLPIAANDHDLLFDNFGNALMFWDLLALLDELEPCYPFETKTKYAEWRESAKDEMTFAGRYLKGVENFLGLLGKFTVDNLKKTIAKIDCVEFLKEIRKQIPIYLGDAKGQEIDEMRDEMVDAITTRLAKIAKGQTLYDRLAAKYADAYVDEPKQPQKTTDEILYECASTDDTRPIMMGIHYGHDGYAVATDAHIIFATPKVYKPEYEGKTVTKKGDVIEGNFPNWKGVIPNVERDYCRLPIDISRLYDSVITANKRVKLTGHKTPAATTFIVTLKHPETAENIEIGFTLDLLLIFLSAATKLGNGSIYIGNNKPHNEADTKGVLFMTNDEKPTYVLLMPRQAGFTIIQDHYIRDHDYECVYSNVFDATAKTAEQPKPKAEPTAEPQPQQDEPQNASDTYRFAEELAKLYADGQKLDLSKAKAINRQNGYNFTTNQLMQACELAVVIRATQIAKGHDRPTTLKEKYDALVDLYSRQVTIQPKDSRASSLQQYSTPAPLAFLLGCFVDNWLRPNATRNYFEPTAGNGLLTIALDHSLTTVNELDDVRFHNLQQIGYQHCYNEDICNPSKDAYMLGINKEFAGVIMNPPFGLLDKKDFLTRKGTIDGREATYTFERLDHKIAILSLEKMRDDGRAAIIIGGKMAVKLGDWKESYWKNGAIFGQYRTFITYLHRQYNIVDILYINGDLYRKQGTTFPIVAILIDGRTEWNDSREHQWHKFDELRDNQIDTFNELYLRLEKYAINRDREANVANYRRLYEPKIEQPDRKRAQALLMLAKAKIKIAQAQQAQRMKQ